MDNYLDHRWPKGPGVQPPPVPAGAGVPARTKKKRSARRWVIPLVSIVLCVAMLGSICFWAVSSIAEMLAQIDPALPDDPRPRISRDVGGGSGWTPDDLPWDDPDPSVALSIQPAGSALSANEAYQGIFPSLVSVEADEPGRYGSTSLGTGVVVAASGYVVTNYHTIDETVAIRVYLISNPYHYYEAKVIGFDEEFDLAVLKFDPDGAELTPARLGDSDSLSVGDQVYAVGNPMGYLLGSMTGGLVSALGRDENEAGSPLGLIQTDAVLNPGNSGGALINESGQVVGITCSKITGVERRSGEAVEQGIVLEGMSMAIPITDALPFLNHILATGETWRPAIGIQCAAAEMDGRRGIRVAEVTGDAPKEAGLRKNDLILTANGTPVASLVELRRVLYRTGADETLSCTVLRDGEIVDISFALMDSLAQE